MFKMPGAIHDLVGLWLTLQIPLIDFALHNCATCGSPSISPGGSENVYLSMPDPKEEGGKEGKEEQGKGKGKGEEKEEKKSKNIKKGKESGKTKYLLRPTKGGKVMDKAEGSYFQPDLSFGLQYVDANGTVVYASPLPRIVLETAFSQPAVDVLNKACEYLYHCQGQQIHAVIICDMTHPVPQDDGFKAKISVWVRAPRTGGK